MGNDDTVTGIILARLERIEGKLDLMQTSGCAKAEQHERTHDDVVELFQRMRDVERVQSDRARKHKSKKEKGDK